MRAKPYQTIDRFTWLTRAGEPATDREKIKDRTARIEQQYGRPHNPADILDHRYKDREFAAAAETMGKIEQLGATCNPKTKPERDAWRKLKRDLTHPIWLTNAIHVETLAKLYSVTEAQALRAAQIAAERKTWDFFEPIAQAIAETEATPDDYENPV